MLWLFLGILIGLGLFWIFTQVTTSQMTVKWYQLVLGALAVITFLIFVQNYIGLKAELEPHAAGFVVWTMGLPAVILAALIWVIPVVSAKVKSRSGSEKVSG